MCRRGMRSREKRNNRVTRLRLTRSRSISILREELPLCRDNTISKCTKRRRPESGKETERARSRNSARVSAEHSPPSCPRLWRPSHPPFTVPPFQLAFLAYARHFSLEPREISRATTSDRSWNGSAEMEQNREWERAERSKKDQHLPSSSSSSGFPSLSDEASAFASRSYKRIRAHATFMKVLDIQRWTHPSGVQSPAPSRVSEFSDISMSEISRLKASIKYHS